MRNADLEREILAANHDPSAYLVYADWLQSQGDVRGELIIRAIQDRDAQAFLDAHREQLLGRFAASPEHYVKLEWRCGVIRAATLRWHEFGGESEADPSSARVDDIAPILEGTATPLLRTLNLRNCPFADALVAALVDAPILRQITSLDLSMGNLSERGLATLIDAKAKLRQITSINLDDNALSDAARARAAELSNATFGTEHTPDRAVPRTPKTENRRYVSVGE